MRLFKRKSQGKEDDSDITTSTKTDAVKCKECSMRFENKDRLKIHSKKAHSGKGEKKKHGH
jgi:hypothetical protein